jgi:PAS domain S-box-containing protein
MIKADQANEELTLELQRLRKRITELEAFHAERQPGGETLQQSEAQTILESFAEGLLVLDKKGRLIDANTKLEEISGYQKRELVGKTTLSLARLLTHKGLTVFWRNPLKRMNDVNAVPHEVDIFKNNGELITVQITCHQLKMDGKIAGHLVILKDLTERRRTERESHESLEVYKSLVSHVGIGIFRVTAGPTGRFLQVNHAMEEITGYSRGELLQINVEDLYVHTEERTEHIKEVLSGVPTKAREFRFKKKDGTEITVRDNQAVVRGDDGKTLYLEGFLEDITQHKKAEQQLQESEENLRNSLDNSPMGIYIIDEDLNTLYANPALLDIFGYKHIDEIKVHPLDEYYSPESRLSLAQRRERYLRGELNPETFELDIMRNDGSIRHLQVFRKDILWSGKKQRQVIYNDITERKNAEKALKGSEQNLQNFLDTSVMGIRIRTNGYIEYANQALIDIFGFKNIEELRANPLENCYTPESYADFLVRKEKIARGEPVPNPIEVEIARKDGTVRHLQVFGKQIFWNGKTQAQTFFNDMTERKQAEAELKESEEKYRALFENGAEGIVVVQDGMVKLVNSQLMEMTGYTNEEVYKKSFIEFIHPEDRAMAAEQHQKRLNGETAPMQYSLRVLNKNGKTLWFQLKGSLITWGNKTATLNMFTDITEQKEAEAALKLSEEKYRLIVENNSEVIFTFDHAERLVYISPSIKNALGYDPSDLIGHSFTSLIHPDDLPDLRKAVQRNIQNGSQTPGGNEYRVRNASGEWRWYNASGNAKFEANGKFMNFTAITRDVHEKKNAELALQASEQNFRNSMESSVTGIRIMGDADYTLYANQALLNMFGYANIEELRKSPPQEHYNPESYANYVRRHEKFAHGESLPDQLEFDIIRKDGAIRHLELSSKNVLWNGKQQYQMLYNDITERKTLEANNAYLASFPEMNTDPIIEIDQEGQLKYFNPACKRNFPDIETLGLNHPILAGWAQLAEELCPNGLVKTRIREMSVGNLIYEQSCFAVNENRIRIYFRDITERKNAERALRASEENFRNSMDNSSMGIRISDKYDHTSYVNKAMLEAFGYADIDAVRTSPPWEYYTPESYASYVLRHEKFVHGESMPEHVEIDIVRKDSGIRHLDVSMKEILWDDRQQFQTLYNDITERKQAEKKLEVASREWRTTFDSITDLISIHDKNNRIVRVNKTVADLLKTTPQELIGKFCHEIMRGDQECSVNCPHLLALKTGKPSSIEIFNSRLGLHLQESASPLFNEKGEITGTVLVARDITQEKRMEEQLLMTDRLASIGELSSGIAHELNNPLTSVIGFSQLLMEGDVPDSIKEDLGIVHSEAQRAADIVKNLLTFARKHAPVKELSNINAVVEDVLRLRSYEQKVNNIEVEKRLSPNLPEIMIDHFQMQQVFLNIMVNAEFAMMEAHHRGRLVVSTEKLAGTIRISFADDGPGISQENLKHIFDPFFTTKEVGKGTGLGLSICHGIVTEHGGQIYATSEKGDGATFVVELPLINEQQC